MSHQFASLYFDEDVDVLVADVLERRGFSALTTRDANRLGLSDSDQFAYATELGRVFVTHNIVDFVKLTSQYFEQGISHAGVLMAQQRPPFELVAAILQVLNEFSAKDLCDRVLYL